MARYDHWWKTTVMIKQKTRGQLVGPMAKSTRSYYRRLEFGPQHPWTAHNCLQILLWSNPTPLATVCTWIHGQATRKHTHTHWTILMLWNFVCLKLNLPQNLVSLSSENFPRQKIIHVSLGSDQFRAYTITCHRALLAETSIGRECSKSNL